MSDQPPWKHSAPQDHRGETINDSDHIFYGSIQKTGAWLRHGSKMPEMKNEKDVEANNRLAGQQKMTAANNATIAAVKSGATRSDRQQWKIDEPGWEIGRAHV